MIKLFFQRYNVFIPDIGFVDIGGRQYVNMSPTEYKEFLSADRKVLFKPVDSSDYYVIIKVESFIIEDSEIIRFMSNRGGVFSFNNILKMIKDFEVAHSSNRCKSWPNTIIC